MTVRETELTPQQFERLAERFRALGETARLQNMNCLRRGVKTVTAIVDETGLGQANVSKHLRVLFDVGFVRRRKEGVRTVYELSDRTVFDLCDIVCGRITADVRAQRKLLQGRG